MHLLWSEGRSLERPEPVPHDARGAMRLAELYAPPRGGLHVRAMMNTTIDGAVAGSDGTSGSLRNPDDSFVFSVLRSLCDVVLVGARTVREEDYSRVEGRADLPGHVHRPGGGLRPALAVLSRSGDVPGLRADQPSFLLAPGDRLDSLRDAATSGDAPILIAESPAQALSILDGRGLRAIQVEGGPSVLGPLVAQGLVDELCFSVSHRTVGGGSSRVLTGPAHDQGWRLRTMLVGTDATITRYTRG